MSFFHFIFNFPEFLNNFLQNVWEQYTQVWSKKNSKCKKYIKKYDIKISFTGKKDIFICFNFDFFSGGGAESRNKFIFSSPCFLYFCLFFVYSFYFLPSFSNRREFLTKSVDKYLIFVFRILVNISHVFSFQGITIRI